MNYLSVSCSIALIVLGLAACEQEAVVTTAEEGNSLELAGSIEEQAKQQESNGLSETIEDRFPNYKPKLSEDTVLEYRPSLAIQFAELPVITSETFTPAVFEARGRHETALANPGSWEDGAMPLGADEREYVPSDEELLAAELGRRIFAFAKDLSHEEIMAAWTGSYIHPPDVEYDHFTFRHVDVMGSGRFFYASEPERVILNFSGLE